MTAAYVADVLTVLGSCSISWVIAHYAPGKQGPDGIPGPRGPQGPMGFIGEKGEPGCGCR
ncbi:hypothetical protein SEA_LONEWOLF_67 [Mycobacterium phage LoneWolf]|nr:hypothetical protein SEA_LONEWOLF_67 [Mycobacterium phage LoneWolf]